MGRIIGAIKGGCSKSDPRVSYNQEPVSIKLRRKH